MNPAAFQFLVVATLATAWIWMLGRPLLRALTGRPRRTVVTDSRPSGRFRPVAEWRAQPIERRRLQVMLGFAIATFASLLLALALRGIFIRLFLVMAGGLAIYLLVAAWIGARELRDWEAEQFRRVEAEHRRSTSARARKRGRALLEELMSQDLFGPIDTAPRVEPSPEPDVAAGGAGPAAAPAAETETAVEIETTAEEIDVAGDATEPDGISPEPTFTAAAVQRSRPPRRPKARPIYIESELDEDDGTTRAVND